MCRGGHGKKWKKNIWKPALSRHSHHPVLLFMEIGNHGKGAVYVPAVSNSYIQIAGNLESFFFFFFLFYIYIF